MDINNLQQKFNLFSQSSSILNESSEHYLPRFNYSACELWLCTELCHLINFEGHKLQALSDGDLFLYNEDNKRDLTLYSSGKTKQPKILTHIEVKVIYPVAKSKFDNAINNLYQKLKSSRHSDYNQEGWIYLVWTQHYAVPLEDFFVSRIEWLKESLDSKAFFDHEDNQLRPHYAQVHNIADGSIAWRGEKKQIVVKAIAFSFAKDFREIL
ncbi:hypothetical protein SJI19_06915 [Acerihabitans sp. TG2]|uniref:hypothetical protein n=1 Tax=Acerihabitans sp. TG2 TaxID=3096008 RepID=UPI002B2235A7|nr:hypothetical protein [Acerihabitans sp. TG2]MEA9390279.1 hypothetical protein [Acerihabitans sp. TG2]